MHAILTAFWMLLGTAQAEPLNIGLLGRPAVSQFGDAQTPTEQMLAHHLWSGLTRLNAQGEPEADLADYWDVSEDRLVYRFQLKEQLRWSDGSNITAEQVRDSLSGLPLMSVEVDGADALILTLTRPRADLLRWLARPELGPRPPEPGLYSGPFVPTARAPGYVDLEPNRYHPRPARGSLRITALQSYQEGQRLFEAGEIHIAPSERPAANTRSVGPRITAVTVNYEAADVGGVSGLDLRHALSMSIDREFLIESLGVAGLTPQTTPLPPGLLLGGSFPVPFEGLSYPDRDGVAEALLSVAGYEEGRPLEVSLLTPDSQRLIQTADWLALEWRAIGVQVTLEVVPFLEFERRLTRGAFQLALRDVPPEAPDAATHLSSFLLEAGALNLARYQVADFEAAYFQAEEAADAAVRRRRHRGSEKELIEDQIRIALYRSEGRWRVSELVQGWPEETAGLPPLDLLWLAP